MKISTCIPVYNSEKILIDSYKSIKKELEKITKDYEILFRNDCSKDNSLEVLKKISDKKVKVFSNERNRGLGFTLRNLFKDAEGSVVIYFDVDAFLCFDLSLLKRFLEELKSCDVIIASRYELGDVPLCREIPSILYYGLNKILFKVKIRDAGSGFVIFKSATLKNINLCSDGFEIHAEIFAKIHRAGFRIKEVPVFYKAWRGGSFSVVEHGFKTLADTLKVWWKLRKSQ